MGTLDEYGLTSLTEDDSIKEKFFNNVNEGLLQNKISLFSGNNTIDLPLPFPEKEESTTKFYDNENETISSHKEKYSRYHEIIFPMVEQIANVLNLEPVGPKAPPIQDPTTPILAIINAIEIPGLDKEYVLKSNVLSYILKNATDFISAAALLPDDWESMYELMIEMPNFPIEDKDIKEKLESLSIDLSLPSIPDQKVAIPSPPFIDIPAEAIPVMSIEGVGIINFILELINAAINTMLSAITKILRKINSFIIALKDGVVGIVNFIIELIMEPIMIVLEKFSSLLDQIGWVSTVGTIIKYTLSMMIMSITTFILGPGLISQGIGQLFGII